VAALHLMRVRPLPRNSEPPPTSFPIVEPGIGYNHFMMAHLSKRELNGLLRNLEGTSRNLAGKCKSAKGWRPFWA